MKTEFEQMVLRLAKSYCCDYSYSDHVGSFDEPTILDFARRLIKEVVPEERPDNTGSPPSDLQGIGWNDCRDEILKRIGR